MNFRHTLCCAVLTAAALLALTACQNQTEESSHRSAVPSGSNVVEDPPAPTPQSNASDAAAQVYHAASYSLIDMRNSGIDTSLLSGDYTFRGSDLEGKTVRTAASTEADALLALQGGLASYFPHLKEQEEIGIRIEGGKCIAAASGKEGVYAGYPAVSEDASYEHFDDAFQAAVDKSTEK